MDSLKTKASTTYGDYKGTISIDGHNGAILHDICRDQKLDEQYFPIAFELNDSSLAYPALDVKASAILTIYAIDKQIAGNNFDEIKSYINKNSGQVKTEQFNIGLTYDELKKYIKRMSIFAVQKGMEDVIEKVI